MLDEDKKDAETAAPSEVTPEPTATVEQKPKETATEVKDPVESVATVQAPQKPLLAEAEPVVQNTPGALILQWLTYAFWGWLILAMIWLAGIVFASAILKESSTSGMIPFALSTSIVLLPIAFFTDRLYRKHEPLTKTGGASMIMVIHAVLFALLGMITLIWTVFTSISLLSVVINNDANGALVSCLVTGFATILYASAFVRTLNPFKNRKPLQIYSIAMLSITILLVILAVVGPFAKTIATRNDRLIEQNLPAVENSVRSYIQDNKKLPDSLNDVTFTSDETSKFVKDGLVEYKKEDSVTETNTNSTSIEHRYQLCVTYTAKSTNSTYKYNNTKNEYADYYSPASSHGVGKECYKLQTTTYTYTTAIKGLDTTEN